MVAEDSSEPNNSFLRTWVAIGILAVLAILLATQFGKIKQTVSELFKKADQVAAVPTNISKLKDFDLSQLKVPQEFAARCDEYQLAAGLSNPTADAADSASVGYLQDQDIVFGVHLHDAACAYPLQILRHRLVVNHELGGQPIAVTYSPLSMSTAVYSRQLNGSTRNFEPTTQLYHSALLFHDKGQPEDTLWNHFTGAGMLGPDATQSLTPLAHTVTTWGRWKAQYPETQALVREGGFDYGTNYYSAYPIDSPEPRYPHGNPDPSVLWKEPVLGVRVGTATRAYPLSVLKSTSAPVTATLGGKAYTLEYVGDNPDHPTAVLTQADDGVVAQYALWFAWHAYYPETEVYQP